jgi:hypothetical protein
MTKGKKTKQTEQQTVLHDVETRTATKYETFLGLPAVSVANIKGKSRLFPWCFSQGITPERWTPFPDLRGWQPHKVLQEIIKVFT